MAKARKVAARSAPARSAPEAGPRPRGRPKKNPGPAAPPAPQAATRPGPILRPRSAGRRKNILTLRGDPRWREWVHRLARHLRTQTPELIDRALVELAEREGFRPRCPER